MTVDQCYKFVQFLARKNQLGSITPTEYASAYNSAQRAWFDTLLGKIVIAPHIALGQNMRISERLKPFKVTDVTKDVIAQIVTYPNDFHALTNMSNPEDGRSLMYVEETRISERLRSVIDPIEERDPAVFTNAVNGWKVWPTSMRVVAVSYYKLPTDVKWAYTLDENGRSVYDANNSVSPLWDNVSNEEILARTCGLLGISFQSPNLVQYSETTKAQGV